MVGDDVSLKLNSRRHAYLPCLSCPVPCQHQWTHDRPRTADI